MTEPTTRRHRGAELVVPVLAVAFIVYYLVSTRHSPWTAKASSYLVASVLLLLLAIFTVVVIRELMRGEADLSLGGLAAPLHYLPRRLGLLALTVAYVVVLEWGGFTLTTAAFLYAAMLLLGGWRVRWTALWLSLAYSLGGYAVFIVAFDTRFPAGPFETFMRTLF